MTCLSDIPDWIKILSHMRVPAEDFSFKGLIQTIYPDHRCHFGDAMYVATSLRAKCEGEAHTPKNGNLESSGTPENSELELKGQNTSHWGVLGVIEKVLKCRCLNWPRIGHLDI